MINFSNVTWKNFLSTGNNPVSVEFLKNDLTLITSKENGSGKCLDPMTKIQVRYNGKELKRTIRWVVDLYKNKPEEIGNVEVLGRFGYKVVEYATMTAKNSPYYKIITDKGLEIKGSPDHLLHVCFDWKMIKNIKVGDDILTKFGVDRVKSITLAPDTKDLYDLQVQDVKEFYANDIVSHNSTLLEALSFCLFNKSFRGVPRRSLLVNSINKKNMEVSCQFSIGNTDYKVVRGLNPAIFEIHRNGEIINPEAKNLDYQEILESKILKMNFKTFTQVVLLGSSNHIPFLELSAQARREVVDNILDINVITTMAIIIRDKLKVLKAELQQKENEINNLKIRYQSSLKVIKLMEKNIEDINNRQKNEEESIRAKIELLESQIKELEENLSAISLEDVDIKELENELDNLKKDLHIKKHTLSCKNKDETFYSNHDDCPTCKQSIDSEFKDSIIMDLNKTINELNFDINNLNNSILLKGKTIKEIKAKEKKVNEYETEMKYVSKELENQIQALNNLIANPYTCDEDMKNLEKEKLTLASVTRLGKESRTAYEELLEDFEVHSQASAILKDNGFKSIVINEYLPVINKLINMYLQKLGSYYSFEFDENFNETIYARHTDPLSYANLSGGERVRLTLAVLFTWRFIALKKNVSPCNILILDEIMDASLDREGVESAIEVLKELDCHVFILTPNSEEIRDLFSSVIEVEKVGDFSTYTKKD